MTDFKWEWAPTMDLIAKAMLMDDLAAIAFLAGRLAVEEIGHGHFLMVMAWINPQEAEKYYRSYVVTNTLPEYDSRRIKAILGAHELIKKSQEEQAAYSMMAALFPLHSTEARDSQLLGLYKQALESPESLMTNPDSTALASIFRNATLLFRFCLRFPEDLEEIIFRNEMVNERENVTIRRWSNLFCIARLLLLINNKEHDNGQELIRLLQQNRKLAGGGYDIEYIYAVMRLIDWLEQNEPDLLHELMPDLLFYYHEHDICGVRMFLRIRVLFLMAQEKVDIHKLDSLLGSMRDDEPKRKALYEWDDCLGHAPLSDTSAEENRLFARRELAELRQILRGDLA